VAWYGGTRGTRVATFHPGEYGPFCARPSSKRRKSSTAFSTLTGPGRSYLRVADRPGYYTRRCANLTWPTSIPFEIPNAKTTGNSAWRLVRVWICETAFPKVVHGVLFLFFIFFYEVLTALVCAVVFSLTPKRPDLLLGCIRERSYEIVRIAYRTTMEND